MEYTITIAHATATMLGPLGESQFHFVCSGGYWIPIISWFIGVVGETCNIVWF